VHPDSVPHSFFARVGERLARRARLVLVVSGALLAAAGWYGSSVALHLSASGLEVPGSESDRETQEAAGRFGVGSADVLLLYRNANGSVRDATFASRIIDALDPVLADPGVLSATTPYDTGKPELVSRDGREMLAILSLAGKTRDKLVAFRRIESTLRSVPLPAELQIGGHVPFTLRVQEIAHRDAARAERLALPFALLLAFWFFRSPLAALLPIAIGALSLAGSAALARVASSYTEISIFAMNVGAFLGLGLSIDYALLFVQRFREELSSGRDVQAAVAATLESAGRAVWVSGTTVALSLAALLPVPIPILHSVAIAGVVVVGSALFSALVMLPALLAVLGRNLDRWSIGAPRVNVKPSRFWRAVGELSMRHPIGAVAGTTALLLTLASPALRLRSTIPDARGLPPGTEVRRVDEALADPARFDPAGASAIPIVAKTIGPPLRFDNVGRLHAFAAQLANLPGVEAVRSPFVRLDADRLSASEIQREKSREPMASLLQRTVDGNASLLVAESSTSWRSTQSARTVAAIRALPRNGLEVEVGGPTAQMVDTLQTLRRYAPLALLLVAGCNFLILLVAFGSLALPIKAVLMNLLSIGASYGVLVWVFQDGHGASGLGFEPLDGIEPTIPLVMFAVVFGLSMDYEVFLLSRIREEWQRSRDNSASVIEGIARTGRIITSAALILLVVVGAFVAGDLVYIKQIGLGIAAAIAIDVTLVRALLVPATMQLLGQWNWWAPRWLQSSPSPWGERGGSTPRTRPKPAMCHQHSNES
jgi:RND superfamily putative drug exporter